MIPLVEMNALSGKDFVAQFGSVYEHSPWVAERVSAGRPFNSITTLAEAMGKTVAAATAEEKLALLREHPDLAGRAALAGELTQSSTEEQRRAGLDKLTKDEMARFRAANTTYRERFGFPFVIAVKHWNKTHMLSAFSHRLLGDRDEEMKTALAEVDKIAFLRLLDLIVPAATGSLTTHALDTARGCPAAGLHVELYRLGEARTLVKSGVTNQDGRLNAPLLSSAEMVVGRYELIFSAGDYFLANGHVTSAPSFLDRVPLAFAIANPEAHYHVPLLLSPWSYSTYRGS